MNVLFVCTANISRSYLAERLFKHEVDKHRLDDIAVSSSGILAIPGCSPDPKMVGYLETLGISPDGHQSRQLDEADVAWADMILVMEKSHYRRIESVWPDAIDKVALLAKYISEDQREDDVIDPFGHSPYHYRLAQSQLSLAVDGLTKRILTDRSVA